VNKNSSIIESTQDYIHTHTLLNMGDTVIIGVSGGPDSVALTQILNELKFALGLHLHIAHFNHGLRKEAAQEQHFVEILARDLNIPFSFGKSVENAHTAQGSTEEIARHQRFRFLIKTARATNADKIALAHHADDLAETVIMRLIRGSGLQGLRAIQPFTRIENIPFIRPLLCIPKEQILSFLEDNKRTYCVDRTNEKTDFFRNQVRHELIPLLARTYNPNIKSVLANAARNMACDYDYLDKEAQAKYQQWAKTKAGHPGIHFSLNELKQCHTAVQRQIFRKTIAGLKGNTRKITFSHMNEIENLIQVRPANSIVHLPDAISVHKTKTELLFTKQSGSRGPNEKQG
jgi:tRNA(Ile)-lysidine synthase